MGYINIQVFGIKYICLNTTIVLQSLLFLYGKRECNTIIYEIVINDSNI